MHGRPVTVSCQECDVELASGQPGVATRAHLRRRAARLLRGVLGGGVRRERNPLASVRRGLAATDSPGSDRTRVTVASRDESPQLPEWHLGQRITSPKRHEREQQGLKRPVAVPWERRRPRFPEAAAGLFPPTRSRTIRSQFSPGGGGRPVLFVCDTSVHGRDRLPRVRGRRDPPA
jgi:hypothetical protein